VLVVRLITVGSMETERCRRSLTPMSGELRVFEAPYAPLREPGLVRRRFCRIRRRKAPPTTLHGALVRGLVRLGVAVGLGAVAAVGVALALDRTTAVGFYLVGALVLAAAFFVSASDISTPYYITATEREVRVRSSFSYMLAGFALLAAGVAVEMFS
jgi:small-conductance mechanosensitive channel